MVRDLQKFLKRSKRRQNSTLNLRTLLVWAIALSLWPPWGTTRGKFKRSSRGRKKQRKRYRSQLRKELWVWNIFRVPRPRWLGKKIRPKLQSMRNLGSLVVDPKLRQHLCLPIPSVWSLQLCIEEAPASQPTQQQPQNSTDLNAVSHANQVYRHVADFFWVCS